VRREISAKRRNASRSLTDTWERAARAADFTLRLPGGVPMFFHRIPAGRFLMGERGFHSDEEPRHLVEITHDYYLGTFPVTQRQWRVVATRCRELAGRTAPSRFKGAHRPVDSVSWDDAQAFCAWLAAWDELPADVCAVRLPTEAEWERACRAGTDTEYYSGDGSEALADVAWYAENSGRETHAVDERAESHPYGLHGMHGNVWEWCRDWYDGAAYRGRFDGVCDPETGTPKDPESRRRVLRGGAWNDAALGCRSAYRGRFRPVARLSFIGFRVCLVRSPAAGAEPGGSAEPARGAAAPRDEGRKAKRAGGARGTARRSSP